MRRNFYEIDLRKIPSRIKNAAEGDRGGDGRSHASDNGKMVFFVILTPMVG